jgi:hypothetical protein
MKMPNLETDHKRELNGVVVAVLMCLAAAAALAVPHDSRA